MLDPIEWAWVRTNPRVAFPEALRHPRVVNGKDTGGELETADPEKVARAAQQRTRKAAWARLRYAERKAQREQAATVPSL